MIGVVKHLSIFFLHTPSIRRNWKKLYRTLSQNRTCWSSTISEEQAGWMDQCSRSYQETLLLHCCLFWEHFSWRFSHVVSWLCDRCQYSFAGNNKNRILQYSCDFQWVSTVSQGPHNKHSREGLLRHSSRQCLRSRLWHHPSSKSERMLTPTTVGGLKQSLKCVMRWGLHHQCPWYVVVNVTEQTYQHLIPFGRTITILILDNLLSDLDKRFS